MSGEAAEMLVAGRGSILVWWVNELIRYLMGRYRSADAAADNCQMEERSRRWEIRWLKVRKDGEEVSSQSCMVEAKGERGRTQSLPVRAKPP